MPSGRPRTAGLGGQDDRFHDTVGRTSLRAERLSLSLLPGDGANRKRASRRASCSVAFHCTPVEWTNRQLLAAASHRARSKAGATISLGARFRRTTTLEPSGTRSQREREDARFVALGKTGPEIADEMHISHDNVPTHARNAMKVEATLRGPPGR